MTNPLDTAERLSAFVDGEMGADEIDALLDSLDNPACRDQLRRFATVGSARDAAPMVDISGAVKARMAAEAPARVVSMATRRPSVLRRRVAWAGLAAAASVAALALNLAPVLQDSAVDAAPVPMAVVANDGLAVATATAVEAQPVAGRPRELVIPSPSTSDLDRLYLQHARYRGGYALAAPVSYGRVGIVGVPVSAETVDP